MISDTIQISAKSALAYTMLKKEYMLKDADYLKELELKRLLIEGSITSTAIKALFFLKVKKTFGTLKCQICGNENLIEKGTEGKSPNNLATIEHVIPKSLGGFKYNDSNFICTCYKCNMERGLKPLFQIKDNMYTF